MTDISSIPTGGRRIAALPMYDFPELRADTDALWTRLAESLADAGLSDVPATLTRGRPHFDLWRDPNLLLAQACEYPIATDHAGAVQLVATPRYTAEGCAGARYRSAIVVRRHEPAETLADMRGLRCVINERSSNSGMNLLRAGVAPLAQGRSFFDFVLISGAHRRSVEMVVNGEADLAAIDCVTWAHIQNFAPEQTGALRVLGWTELSPSLPLVTAATADAATVRALRDSLNDLIADPALAPARERLFLAGFDFEPDRSFTQVLGLARRATELHYPDLV
jgi:ABC-type phosphate/phosphonate transport system substrate-binding protein